MAPHKPRTVLRQKSDGSVASNQSSIDDFYEQIVDEIKQQDLTHIADIISQRKPTSSKVEEGDLLWIPSLSSHVVPFTAGSGGFMFSLNPFSGFKEYFTGRGDYELVKKGSSQPGSGIGKLFSRPMVKEVFPEGINPHSFSSLLVECPVRDRRNREMVMVFDPSLVKKNIVRYVDGFFEGGYSFVELVLSGDDDFVTLEKGGKEIVESAYKVFWYESEAVAEQYVEWLNSPSNDTSTAINEWLKKSFGFNEGDFVRLDWEKVAECEKYSSDVDRKSVEELVSLTDKKFFKARVFIFEKVVNTEIASLSFLNEYGIKVSFEGPLSILKKSSREEKNKEDEENNKRKIGKRYYQALLDEAGREMETIAQLTKKILAKEKLARKKYQKLEDDPLTFYENHLQHIEEQKAELEKDKRIERMEIKDEGISVFTNDLFVYSVVKGDKDITKAVLGENVPLKIGKYQLWFPFHSIPHFEAHISRIKGISGRHPHQLRSNDMCLGNMKDEYLKAMAADKYAEGVKIGLEVMENINLDNPAVDFAEFYNKAVEWSDPPDDVTGNSSRDGWVVFDDFSAPASVLTRENLESAISRMNRFSA